MKKWTRTALTLGLASSLVVPSMTSANTLGNVYNNKKDEPYNVVERLKLSTEEQSKLGYVNKTKQTDQYSEDTLIVKYHKQLSAKVHKQLGTYVVKSYPDLGYEVVRIKKGKKLDAVQKAYKEFSEVISAAPAVKLQQYGSKDPKIDNMYQLRLLEIDKALSLAGDHEVTVAVIDGGVDTNHPELKSKVLAPYNVADPANPGMADYHGTHVAGIIASEKDNGIGGHGINPKAKIMPINVFERNGSFDYILADAILYAAENGADVINMSLGASFEMPLVEEAIKVAAEKGVVIVAAAGNDGAIQYNYPAGYDGVITVGATNDQNKLAEFSTYGPQIDVVAPGEDVYSTLYEPVKGSTFVNMSGTSMASPVVAGVASLIKSKYPDLNTYQVEAILEQTATDKGKEGFDLEYGWGLVNPVAALKYDIKKLPTFEKMSDESILKTATELNLDNNFTSRKGKLMTPEEVDYVKVNVAEGEYIQSTLMGSGEFDHELVLRFYPEGETTSEEPVIVGDAAYDETEGRLFKAPSNGTLVIGIKDRNENYSPNGKSSYELTLQSATELAEDIATAEEPISISKLPFNSKVDVALPLQLVAEESHDSDYFMLSFEEPTLVEIDLSAIPGVNTAMNLYFAEEFYMPLPEWLPEYEKEYWPYPIDAANMNGSGEKEVLTFEAMPGMDLILEVTGTDSVSYNDLYYLIYGESAPQTEEAASIKGSIQPYDLKVTTKQLPPDEDGYPMMDIPYYPEEPMEEVTEEAVQERLDFLKKSLRMDHEGEYYYSEFTPDETDQIVNSAVPLNIGEEFTGYFQTAYDYDWLTFTVDKTGFYQFNMPTTDTLFPNMMVYEYDHNVLASIYDSWMYYDPFFGMSSDEVKVTLTLEEGKTYFVRLMNERRVSFEPYTFSSTYFMDAPEDANEDNDTPIRATILNDKDTKTGNFALLNDTDMFYYKNRQDEKTVNFSLKPVDLTDEQKSELPAGITAPLDLVGSIIEDTDGNMQISDDEANKSIIYDLGFDHEPEAGSFKARKDVGYFIVVDNYYSITSNVNEYELSLYESSGVDEDAKSVVKNNIPSQPISLHKDGANKWKAEGKLNGGVAFGDKDYYKVDVASDGKLKVGLTLSSDLDGVITIYDQKGQQVSKLDYYGIGDDEIGEVSVKKGTYFIKVEDVYARSSVDSYKLSVELTK
ncbi:S8 family serine peptidase [Bacillus sp. AK128]